LAAIQIGSRLASPMAPFAAFFAMVDVARNFGLK